MKGRSSRHRTKRPKPPSAATLRARRERNKRFKAMEKKVKASGLIKELEENLERLRTITLDIAGANTRLIRSFCRKVRAGRGGEELVRQVLVNDFWERH